MKEIKHSTVDHSIPKHKHYIAINLQRESLATTTQETEKFYEGIDLKQNATANQKNLSMFGFELLGDGGLLVHVWTRN